MGVKWESAGHARYWSMVDLSILVLCLPLKDILTIEGLGEGESLDPVQEAFVEKGAIQCGFCSPGMIMSSKALLDKNPKADDEEIKEALKGNLCRCTGYVKIMDAVKAAGQKMEGGKADER